MTIAVAVLVVAGVLTVFAATIFVVARSLRRISAPVGTGKPRTTSRTPAAGPPPFGALPTLNDPVGPLGNPALDADLSSNAESAREIYGE